MITAYVRIRVHHGLVARKCSMSALSRDLSFVHSKIVSDDKNLHAVLFVSHTALGQFIRKNTAHKLAWFGTLCFDQRQTFVLLIFRIHFLLIMLVV